MITVLIGEVGLPAVMDHNTPIAGYDANILNRLQSALGMEAFQCNIACRVDMDPVLLSIHPQ